MKLFRIYNQLLSESLEDNQKSFELNEDELLDEDYPQGFSFDELHNQKNYAAKKRYVSEHLRKLSAGTGRDVYVVDSTKVLKMAKNPKGLAQNYVEADWGLQKWYDHIVAKVFDVDESDDRYWIEMELAKKLTPTRFKQLTGYKFEDFVWYIQIYNPNYRSKIHYGYEFPEGVKERLEDDQFVMDMFSMIADFDMPAEDFRKLNSYGEVVRDGEPQVVVVDYGLNQQVLDTHYRPKKKYNY